MGVTYSNKYQAMFQRKRGAECMEQAEEMPQPVRMFGDFIYEGDFAVLCGPEGAGKSVLGLQIADALSRGQSIEGLEMECGPKKVAYLDFENKRFEFMRRYSENGQNPYPFNDNFFRLTFHPQYYGYTGVRKEMLLELRRFILNETQVLVVNNLEFLRCFVAESYVLGMLKELQVGYKMTVLLLAGSGESKPGIKAGLSRLSRPIRGIADSIFAMGKSRKGENIRYIKQLKSSLGHPVYHDKNVAEFTIGKTGNFTGLSFTGFGREFPHVAEPPTGEEAKIIELKLCKPALTYLEIAGQLDTYKMKVKRVLDKYEELLEENSKTEILNSKVEGAQSVEAVVTNVTSALTPDDQDGGIARLSSIQPKDCTGVREEPSTFKENSKTETLNSKVEGAESLGAVVTNVTSNFENTVSSPYPLLLPADSVQGGMHNAEPCTGVVEPVLSDPFRGEVEPLDHSSDSGVKKPLQLTYGQQLKKRLAEAKKRK